MRLSMNPCSRMVALIRSTAALSRRCIRFMPPSSIARWASTEVNRSSNITTRTAGNRSASLLANPPAAACVSLGEPSVRTGSPTTIISTPSEATYSASHGMSCAVGKVSSPPAMMRCGSLTAIPVRFVP